MTNGFFQNLPFDKEKVYKPRVFFDGIREKKTPDVLTKKLVLWFSKDTLYIAESISIHSI